MKTYKELFEKWINEHTSFWDHIDTSMGYPTYDGATEPREFLEEGLGYEEFGVDFRYDNPKEIDGYFSAQGYMDDFRKDIPDKFMTYSDFIKVNQPHPSIKKEDHSKGKAKKSKPIATGITKNSYLLFRQWIDEYVKENGILWKYYGCGAFYNKPVYNVEGDIEFCRVCLDGLYQYDYPNPILLAKYDDPEAIDRLFEKYKPLEKAIMAGERFQCFSEYMALNPQEQPTPRKGNKKNFIEWCDVCSGGYLQVDDGVLSFDGVDICYANNMGLQYAIETARINGGTRINFKLRAQYSDPCSIDSNLREICKEISKESRYPFITYTEFLKL